MTYTDCPCCDPSKPEHALVDLTDTKSGDVFKCRVSHDHRHTSLSWHDRPRVHWEGENGPMVGLESVRGHGGISAIDDTGKVHKLKHGAFKVRTNGERRDGLALPQSMRLALVPGPHGRFPIGIGMQRLRKAPAHGPGERWITVHPRGDDAKGVAVLITENKDGTHRVIGGAGGKLQHLRLKGVAKDTPANREKWKAKSAERQKKGRAKEKERKAAQSPEEQEQETKTKAEIKEAKRATERDFVVAVRDKLGGVDDDLDDKTLEKIPNEGAANLIRTQHHNKQYRQANKALRDKAEALASNEADRAVDREMIRRSVEADPVVHAQAREMAEIEMDLQAQEERERREERAAKSSRTGSAAAEVGHAAAETSLKALAEEKDLETRLNELGGREAPGDVERASDDVERQALVALNDAQTLVTAAEGGQLDDKQQQVVDEAMGKLGRAGEDPEEHAGALKREAGRQVRRAEIKREQGRRYQAMEDDGDEQRALGALAFSQLAAGITKDAAEYRKKLGLDASTKAPMREADIHEIRDLLGKKAETREALRAFKSMVKEAESGNYDSSRRAADLTVSAPPDAVDQDVADQVRTQMTRQLLGVADPSRGTHGKALAAGHYGALADVALGIGKQRYLDRTTVDAVGVGNASILTRWALQQDGHDDDTVLEALEAHHVSQVDKLTTDALAKVEASVPGLQRTVTDLGSMQDAAAHLDAYEADLDDAQDAVGAALGKLEATATLSQAYRGDMPADMSIPLQGAGDVQTQLQWLHAAGLTGKDYTLDTKGKVIRVPQSSWHKLVDRLPQDELDRRQDVADIKSGKQDEKGWLPAGIKSRSATTFNRQVPDAPRHFRQIDLSGGLESGLRSHVGSRIADGEAPHEILTDLLSPGVLGKSEDESAFAKSVTDLFPMKDSEGKAQPSRFFDDHYRELADDHMEATTGSTVGSVHSQDIGVDDPKTHEALFRTLAERPMHRVAFTPTGQLTPNDRRALQDHFYDRMGIADTRSYQETYQKQVDELGPEPEKHGAALGMFGGPARPSPEWEEWKGKAMEVVRSYPREGRELGHKLLGDQPESVKHPALSDEILEHVDAVHKEAPWMQADKVVQQARKRLGSPEALKQGHDPDRHDVLDRSPAEQFAPQIDPQHVHDYLAPGIHDAHKARLERRATQSSTPWAQFVHIHGGLENAHLALQDELKGDFAKSFRKHHSDVTGKPRMLAQKVDIHNRDRHIFGTSTPEEQAEYRKARGKEISGLRARDVGRYADEGGAGAVLDKERKALEQDQVASQAQGGMFGGRQAPGLFGAVQAPAGPEGTKRSREELEQVKTGERLSLGARAEGQIESLMGQVGQQFDPRSKPVDLFPNLNMDGSRVDQQRAVKMLAANGGRMQLTGGTGFGKTLTTIGQFTEEHHQGRASHGVFLTKTGIMRQFGGEMLKYTEPGKYNWTTSEGKGHGERVAALADKGQHMKVFTHAAFRDSALRMMADHQNVTHDEMRTRLRASKVGERAKWYRDAADHHGISPHFMYNDEAHETVAREGAETSMMNLIVTAAGHPSNSTHYVRGSATPVKNDASEAWSTAADVDPDKYGERRDFMSSFGDNLHNNPDALRRELDHVTFTSKIDPEGVQRYDSDNPRIEDGKKVSEGAIKLDPQHQAKVDRIHELYHRARRAHAEGGVDIEAMKELSPGGFDSIPEEEHEELARRKATGLGTARETALTRTIGQEPIETNKPLRQMVDVVKHDVNEATWTDRQGNEHKGKPTIIFTDSVKQMHLINDSLGKEGVRSTVYHGGMNVAERGKVTDGFKGADRAHDVIVATRAMEAGVHAVDAKTVHHADVPMTQKAHQQRSGRAYRQGQQGDVDVHNWHTDTEFHRRARRRLRRKAGLAEVMEDPIGPLEEHGIAGHYGRALTEKNQGREQPIEMAA